MWGLDCLVHLLHVGAVNECLHDLSTSTLGTKVHDDELPPLTNSVLCVSSAEITTAARLWWNSVSTSRRTKMKLKSRAVTTQHRTHRKCRHPTTMTFDVYARTGSFPPNGATSSTLHTAQQFLLLHQQLRPELSSPTHHPFRDLTNSAAAGTRGGPTATHPAPPRAMQPCRRSELSDISDPFGLVSRARRLPEGWSATFRVQGLVFPLFFDFSPLLFFSCVSFHFLPAFLFNFERVL